MDEKQKQIIERISAAKFRKQMAENHVNKAKTEIQKLCKELNDAGFTDGNYMINDRLVFMQVFGGSLTVKPIKISS